MGAPSGAPSPSSPARPPDDFNLLVFENGAYDLSGFWQVAGAPRGHFECDDSVTRNCARVLDAGVMAGRDYLELREAAAEEGEMATPWVSPGDFRGTNPAIRITYDGTYVHWAATGRFTPRDSFGRSFWLDVCQVFPVRYEGTATLLYDQEEHEFAFEFEGAIGTDVPLFERPPTLHLVSRNRPNSLGVEEDFFDPRELTFSERVLIGVSSSGDPVGSMEYPSGFDACRHDFPDPWLGARMFGGRVFELGPFTFRRAPSRLDLDTTLVGRVVSPAGGPDISRAQVQLLRVLGPTRLESRGARTAAEWAAYVAEHTEPLGEVSVDRQGNFSFANVPLLRRYRSATGRELAVDTGPAFYVIGVTGAEADVDPDVFGTSKVYYQSTFEVNVASTDTPTIELTVLPELQIKRELVELLSDISPVHYAPAEADAVAHLDALTAGGGELDDVQLDGLRRGIWAERVVRQGSDWADVLMDQGLGGVGDFTAAVLEDFVKLRTSERRQQNATHARWEEGGMVGDLPEAAQAAVLTSLLELIQSAFHVLRLEIRGGTLLADSVLDLDASDDIDGFLENMELVIKFAVDLYAGGGLRGGFGRSASILAKTLIPALQPLLFDGRPLEIEPPWAGDEDQPIAANFVLLRDATTPWTQDRAPTLSRIGPFMAGWDTAVPERDAFAAYDVALSRIQSMADGATAVNYRAIHASWAAGDLFENIETVFGVLGEGWKPAKSVELGAKVLKFVALLWAAIEPLAWVYFDLPETIDVAAYELFGMTPPEAIRFEAPPLLPPAPAAGAATVDLASDLSDAVAAASTELLALEGALEAGEAAAVVGAVSRVTEANAAAARALRDLFLVTVVAAELPDERGRFAITPGRRAFAARWDVVGRAEAVRLAGLRFAADASSGELDPSSALYHARRAEVRREIDGLEAAYEAVAERVTSRLGGLEAVRPMARPVVVVDELSLSGSGGREVTSAGEELTLRVRVRNLGASAVSGLSARLRVIGPDDAFAATGEAAQTIGSLAAGAQTELEWRIAYSGALGDDTATAIVSLEEDGEPARGFLAVDLHSELSVSPRVWDPDADGMPSAFESSVGLDPETHDADGDLDGDGIPNGVEHDLGLDPSSADTDGDGLSDGEERSAGEDGFRTDARDPDTDGDGTDDGDDGRPLDASTVEATGPPPEEPTVALEVGEVVLTRGAPRAHVRVTNGGTGRLSWSAEADDGAVAAVAPQTGQTRGAPGTVIVSIPSGFDFDRTSALSTVVRVVDVAGATADVAELTVTVQSTGEAPVDAGPGDDFDAGPFVPPPPPDGGGGGGCGCRATHAGAASWPLLLVSLAALLASRRRRPIVRH